MKIKGTYHFAGSGCEPLFYIRGLKCPPRLIQNTHHATTDVVFVLGTARTPHFFAPSQACVQALTTRLGFYFVEGLRCPTKRLRSTEHAVFCFQHFSRRFSAPSQARVHAQTTRLEFYVLGALGAQPKGCVQQNMPCFVINTFNGVQMEWGYNCTNSRYRFFFLVRAVPCAFLPHLRHVGKLRSHALHFMC